MSNQFKGKKLLVVGGTSGMGMQIACTVLADGICVVIAGYRGHAVLGVLDGQSRPALPDPAPGHGTGRQEHPCQRGVADRGADPDLRRLHSQGRSPEGTAGVQQLPPDRPRGHAAGCGGSGGLPAVGQGSLGHWRRLGCRWQCDDWPQLMFRMQALCLNAGAALTYFGTCCQGLPATARQVSRIDRERPLSPGRAMPLSLRLDNHHADQC